MKLAFIALVLGLGTGACVADDPASTGRVEGDVTNVGVATEVEIPTDEGTNGDFEIVVVTGVEIPGRTPTGETFDLTNALTADATPTVREICAQADQLPGSDVCSQICQPGFAAKLLDQGTPGGCTQRSCDLPGDITVNLDACVGD